VLPAWESSLALTTATLAGASPADHLSFHVLQFGLHDGFPAAVAGQGGFNAGLARQLHIRGRNSEQIMFLSWFFP
jgi:hypothetical protein